MDNKKITVIITSKYGHDLIYPACDLSKTFCELLGQKTFTLKNIQVIKKLGYEIEVKTQKREL